jgi:uncharacterized protein
MVLYWFVWRSKWQPSRRVKRTSPKKVRGAAVEETLRPARRYKEVPFSLEPGYDFRVPVFHECQRCTACCRWPGQVRLSVEEIAGLANHLGLDERDFIQQFTRLRADRRGLALMDKPNGECIFLEGENCAVQSVKPQQCRDFPNLWNFPGFERICRAVPALVSDEEYRRRVAAATGRSLNPS